MMDDRVCEFEGCPYRSHGLHRGRKSGYCGMVRPMLAFGCPARRSDAGRA